MTRQYFNPSRPVFVKANILQSAGRFYKNGERFNWEFASIPPEKIQILFDQDMLHHNEDLEEEVAKKVSIGDGLDELTIEQLHVLVERINGKVKEKTTTTKEFLLKKCATLPKDREKQIRKIRAWRATYGDMEN